jgi:pimeloyl-ACP methyl ester carboxylesterase
VLKLWWTALAAALVLFVGEATGSATSRQELRIPMDDGVSIAATLYLPDGAPPTAGWPAVVILHGLAQNRTLFNALAESSGYVGQQYAILTFDARGHGESGGLVTIDGPREISDTRAVFQWLADRPDVDGNNIGAWGLSYGGGAVLNSLVGGVPWAAVVGVETWTDLFSAVMPQGLVKSGLVAGLAGSIPEARRDPSLGPLQAAAFAGNAAAVKSWAAERSSLSRLGSVTTPVFIAQGRRDFLFGIDQGARAFQRLRGPKTLYVGLHGHAPSTFPAADSGVLMARAKEFFDCWLVSATCNAPPASVYVAPENFTGAVARRGATLPPVRPTVVAFPGVSTFAKTGKAVRSAPLQRAVEVFGSPTVKTSAAASGGWSRLVAVLTARTPRGNEIVVAAGGVPTKRGAQKLTIKLSSQATFIPRGSRLTLTLGSSSLAQSTSNLLYLDLPMPPTARVRVGSAVLTLPGLRTPVTR